jgi:ketosteroid isomerase-like protein
VIFEFEDLRIHAGSEVAFATAIGHCHGTDTDGLVRPLDFRLTMGFRKIDGQWMLIHEHHSIPAIS